MRSQSGNRRHSAALRPSRSSSSLLQGRSHSQSLQATHFSLLALFISLHSSFMTVASSSTRSSSSSCSSMLSSLLVYTTTREVRIHEPSLALAYYACVGLLMLYIILGDFVAGHAYQASCTLVSSVDTKAKGQAIVENLPGKTVLDASDLVTSTGDGFFAATSLRTTQQLMGTCTGVRTSEQCTVDAECKAGAMAWSGEQTGKCVDNPSGTPPKTCEVYGWCPGEPEGEAGTHDVQGVGNFTVFARINSRFECDGGRTYRYTNALGSEPTPGVNLFTINEMIEGLGELDAGMDVALTFAFNCDLDRGDVQKTCTPSISTRRLDNVDGSTLSEGYNLRTVTYGDSISWDNRTLTKWYGIRVRVRTVGRGRRFSASETFAHIGSGVAMLGVAAVITDFLLMYVFRHRAQLYELLAQRKVLVADATGSGGTAEEITDDNEQPLLR